MDDARATAPIIEDRRTGSRARHGGEERRVADRDRRIAPRMRTLKGARLIVTGGPPIPCLVRNISETGARIQITEPVLHNVFVLVFDDEAWPPRTCRVVWRREGGLGVTFETAGPAAA
jgi:hypothetical protein